MSDTPHSKRIGELNGFWAVMFKITQIGFPILIAWAVWVTQQLYSQAAWLARFDEWRNIGPRFTATDGDRLRLQIMSEQQVKFDALQRSMTRIEVLIEQHLKDKSP